MKKLFASLPMIGLILGAIAITTEIRADYSLKQPSTTVTIESAVLTAAIAHHNGYLATFMADTSK